MAIEPASVTLRLVGDTVRLRAAVRDGFGNVVQGVDIVWSSTDAAVAAVDAEGLVSGLNPGVSWIRATARELEDSVEVRVEPPVFLQSASADSMAAPVGTRVTLRVRVTDEHGAPRPGIPVSWAVDGGSVDPPTETVTGALGEARAEWTLGTTAGLQRATASVARTGSPLTLSFTARAEPGPPATGRLEADSVLLGGRGERVRLRPAVFDSFGNPVAPGPGTVTWTGADPGVIEVDADGLVTARGQGVSVLQAVVNGAPTDGVRVEVQLRGAITLTFDDGWRSVYENAWPVLRDHPWLRANVGVYTEAVGWPGYLTEAQLDELHGAGWSMVSHTVSHDSLSTLAASELARELGESRAWLEARGYRGSNVLIAPYHDFPSGTRSAAAGFYDAARGASAHATDPETLVEWMPDAPLELTGIPADDLPYTTPEGRDRLRSLLRRTVDEGAFLDLFLHQVPPGNVPAFRDLVAVLEEFRDRIRPYHELFPVEPRTVR